jgi:hypothetical protein
MEPARVGAALSDQGIATIQRRHEHHIVVDQRRRCLAQHRGIQRRGVGAHQQRPAVQGQLSRQRAVHALAQVAGALLGQHGTAGRSGIAQRRVRRIGRRAQLDRADRGRRGLGQRVAQHACGQRGGACGPQGRGQACLGQAGHRRLGQHDDGGAHR